MNENMCQLEIAQLQTIINCKAYQVTKCVIISYDFSRQIESEYYPR